MAGILAFVLGNFTLTFLVIGVITAAVSVARKPRPHAEGVWQEALLAHFILFSIGVSFFYNFVFHVFFGKLAAYYIGWADSPFQAEVGFASLGFALVGFLAFRQDLGLRVAAIVGPSAFLLGAAVGHIYQMVTTHNFAPGNAGIIFYTDIILPIIGFVLLWLRFKPGHGAGAPAADERIEPMASY
jgi:hypothetical protein